MLNDNIAASLCTAFEPEASAAASDYFTNFKPTQWTGGANFCLNQRLNEHHCQIDVRAYWTDQGSVHNSKPHAYVAFDSGVPGFGLNFRLPNLTPAQARRLAANLQMAVNEADEFERLAKEKPS